MKFDTVYVDGDLLLYSIAFATQKNIYHIYVDNQLAWVGSSKKEINRIFKGIEYDYEKYVNIQPMLSAVETYKTVLKRYQKQFETNDVVVVLTGDTNYRNEVAISKPYKGTRHQDKPYNYADLKKYMIKQGAVVTVDEEADDYLSYMTCNKYNTVAITQDKDALNTPSYIYRPDTQELVHVSEQMATKSFWTQVLTGDSVDNIPGLPNCGKVKAATVLEGCTTYQECEQAVAMAYAVHPKVDDPEAYLTEQAILLWMRREPGEIWHIGLN